MRYSGIQKEILNLYRNFLKEIKKKPADSQIALLGYVRQQFKEKASLNKRDMNKIEYWKNFGQQKLQILQRQEAQGFSFFSPCIMQRFSIYFKLQIRIKLSNPLHYTISING
jgi:succinate dehydrogenase assembly factor 1